MSSANKEPDLEEQIDRVASKGEELLEKKIQELEPKFSSFLDKLEKWLDKKLG